VRNCVLTPGSQTAKAQDCSRWALRVSTACRELMPGPLIDTRVRIGRAWTCWPGAAARGSGPSLMRNITRGDCCCRRRRVEGQGAEHVLIVHSHGVFLDVTLTPPRPPHSTKPRNADDLHAGRAGSAHAAACPHRQKRWAMPT